LQTAFLMIPLTLLYIVEVAFLLKISIPRIAAMERACALFDAHDELLSPTPERETSVATRQNT